MTFPKKLKYKINQRQEENTLRQIGTHNNLIDFSSNDYLGYSKSKTIFNASHQYLLDHNFNQNGATGSRLLSGNHPLYNTLEAMLCKFHNSEAALVFNSGYDANLGFFSSIPQRQDIILYDEYIHASIRDGIHLSNAKAFKFKHNDLEHLKEVLLRFIKNDKHLDSEIYIVTESVFSMDGDSPNLIQLSQICKKHNAHLIVDEAHAVGVLGKDGCGEVKKIGLEQHVFARLITFGKALGCHGAVILGNLELKQYLINFSHSFIYTTALPPHSLATILSTYNELSLLKDKEMSKLKKLHENISFFKSEIERLKIQPLFVKSDSAIQCCILPGNEQVKTIATQLKHKGFDVKPIVSPTIPKGQERLRFCLHSFNKKEEISEVLQRLATFVK